MNTCILIGNTGNDPDIRNTPSGKTVISVSLATRSGKDKTDWHRLIFWENEHAKKIKKGDKIAVQGSVNYHAYTNKEGVQVNATEINCFKFEWCGGNKEARNPQQEIPFEDQSDEKN